MSTPPSSSTPAAPTVVTAAATPVAAAPRPAPGAAAAPSSRPLPPPRVAGSTGAALVHAILGLGAAIVLTSEPAGAFTMPAFRGAAMLVDWLPGPWWNIWAGLLAAPSVAVLLGRGGPSTRWALVVLAAVWAAWGAGALAAGVKVTASPTFEGWLCLGIAALAVHAAAALGRRRS